MESIDIPLLRAAFTIRQGFNDKPSWSSVPEAIKQIAAVQIDTISVVSRSHHLTLRNRVRNYKPDMLWNAQRQKRIFEHVAHASCFVPIEEYPYYRYRMKRFSTHCSEWEKSQLKKLAKEMDLVEARIRNEGALSSKDFIDPSGKKRTGFWDLKPAKRALHFLWETGRLAVAERKGFQIFYDLPERVIPSQYFDQNPDQAEVWRYFLIRNLDCLVAGTSKDIMEYIFFSNLALDIMGNRTKTIDKKLHILQQEDIVTKIQIVNEKKPYYVLTRNLELFDRVQDHSSSISRAWLLNPFDNLVWNRKRVQCLFDFEVKLEAYTPAAQRRFGYYITPILWQQRLIGRIDPKADRDTSTLILQNIELILPKREQAAVIEPIQAELHRYMAFHELETLRIKQATPSNLKAILNA